MTATDCVVVAPSARPEAARALEASDTVSVSVRRPALAAVTTTLRVEPAEIRAGLATPSCVVPATAVTPRSSWKAAAVITVLVTARLEVAPTRTPPKATVELSEALAKS